MTQVITFPAQVARVQTLADGGLRFTFDAPEDAVMQAAQLMECKRFGVGLVVNVEAQESEETQESATKRKRIHV